MGRRRDEGGREGRGNAELDLLIRLPLGLFGVAGATLGFTQRADGGVAVNLLVTGQARLSREREREGEKKIDKVTQIFKQTHRWNQGVSVSL